KGLNTMEIAPIVKLDEARGWALDPPAVGKRFFEVGGFVTETGVDGTWRRFKMVEDGVSLAARKNFTESIGLITAAFYVPVKIRGTVPEDKVTEVNIKE